MILVQNRDGRPLSPCHPARARKLLKAGKAKVISTYPFTIKLTYQVKEPVFTPTRVILDDGKTCGLGVMQENKTHNLALCKVEMATRGEQISDNLKDRKVSRAQSRGRWNKKRGVMGEARINYRKQKQEYPPSIRADAEAKVNAVRVDFVKKREGYKTNFSFYKPETLKIIQKSSSQTWVIQYGRLSSPDLNRGNSRRRS
ncbi:hypothetical protein Daud_0812 [Candidatus Desulforudis audaxviator MP104C]|uniref:RRXRR domain-containing protein n=1 Tax=Desulforudis audaxviator (strain MP104C) TaxID=477974 RepID=B1I2Y1_DESAP|nr:hypothetical protein Daud_0812 [Candidatus Desulforudis audaxviator MP104C]